VRAIGRLIGLFSFDIGYEINLELARQLTREGESGELERRRAAPASLAYASPPLRLPLGVREVRLGATPLVSCTASATMHDFGAVTIVLQIPLETEVDALPGLTSTLTASGPLESEARDLLQDLYQRIAPAVVKPGLNFFVEDYYVIQVDRLDPPATVPELLAAARGPLASALRCEPSPLSEAETSEVFQTQLSYYPDDLVITEWNVAFILDSDYADAVNVLEYLNVQLVELRFYDALLDRRVADTYAKSASFPRRLALMQRPHRRAIEELATIRIDVATIFERIHNALKLSGSLYLAKLYARTAERLGLRFWEESVGHKLDVLQQMYNVLVERATTARAEALEMTIVVLILVELMVALIARGR
jgi:hypothetical protein